MMGKWTNNNKTHVATWGASLVLKYTKSSRQSFTTHNAVTYP